MTLKLTKTSILVAVALSLLTPTPLQAATKPKAPKVGECHALTIEQITALTSGKKPVLCSATHSTETYRVVTWREKKNLTKLLEVERRGLVEPLCQISKIEGSPLTTWSYKIPTTAQWKAGARWIRCDGYSLSLEDPTVVITFKGKQLRP